LQIKSKLLAGDEGSEPRRRVYFSAFSPEPLLAAVHFCLTAPADAAVTGLLFASRLEVVSNIRAVARLI
jgi:hypothetical protein